MILVTIRAALWAISAIVPRAGRVAWREEWLAETDHVARARGGRAAAALARGALADAWGLRRIGRGTRRSMSSVLSLMDVKLGLRMLARYPGLALVSVLGMAVAIAIGAVSFTVIYGYMQPSIPLAEGDRLVSLDLWDADANLPEPHALADFARWRSGLRTLSELGAYRSTRRNLIVPGGQVEPIEVAVMSASGFQIARVPPLLGRPLVDADERASAAPVVVIGAELWRRRLAADPAIVGRTIRLGETVHTIVGVMPDTFGFPVNFTIWVPLRLDPLAFGPRQGPAIGIFGRLAPVVSRADAQAELTALGQRMAAAEPKTHAHLRPRVMPFAALYDAVTGSETARWQVHLIQSLFTMILVLVCANVAVLIYARTATRMGEIAVRTALGATRARIVGQLFVEALVLSGIAAVLGLLLARFAMRELDTVLITAGGGMPFWIRPGLSTGAVLYSVGLGLLGAAIAGVLPALQATGRHVQSDLRQLGGATGMRLGGTWTALIVSQVALAVAVLPWVLFQAAVLAPYATMDPGVGTGEFIVARLAMDDDPSGAARVDRARQDAASRFGARQTELRQRLASEPGVQKVAFSAAAPGDERTAWVEIDGVRTPSDVPLDVAVRAGRPGFEVRTNRVGVEYFETLDVPVLAGHPLTAADAGSASTAIVVNHSFAKAYLGNGSPLGRRVRYVGRSGDAPAEDVQLDRWYEIVGIVGDFPLRAMDRAQTTAKIYHALGPGQRRPVTLSIRIAGVDPAALIGRTREATAAFDPALRLENVQPLDAMLRQEQGMIRLAVLAVSLLAASVLLLSAAGIYALMSFTVAKRRKEIGIRIALGAEPRRIIGAVFSRAIRQIVAGIAVGVVLSMALNALSDGEVLHGNGSLLLAVVGAVMGVVCVAATIVPTRRALHVHPTDALRAEA